MRHTYAIADSMHGLLDCISISLVLVATIMSGGYHSGMDGDLCMEIPRNICSKVLASCICPEHEITAGHYTN